MGLTELEVKVEGNCVGIKGPINTGAIVGTNVGTGGPLLGCKLDGTLV